MSDRSDEAGREPETPGSEGDPAGGPETAPLPAVEAPTPADGTPADTPDTPAPHDTPQDVLPRNPLQHDTRPQDPAEPTPAPTPEPTTPPAAPQATPATAPLTPPATAPPTSHHHAADTTATLHLPGDTDFLTATGLTATGRQGPIFTDITLTAGLGQLVAICGDGGEGRSSLLLALTGRFPHQDGTLEVDGETRPGRIRRRFTIAQAGPPIRFDPYATVAACIKETTAVSKGAATRANVNAWLDRLAVTVDTGDTYGFLPRIDQIRFAIACAAASRTPAIAVDDTDRGLDTRGSERVFDALRTVADAGQLVIAACTRSDPPADTIVDLRAQPAPANAARRHHDGHRKGAHR